MKITYSVKTTDVGKSINHILSNHLNISTRLLSKLIKRKNIFVNQNNCNTNNIVKLGDILEIDFAFAEDNSNIYPTKMDLNIVYEDDWFLVLNKTSGIPIHPSRLHYTDSLSNGVKYYFDAIGLPKKVRPVNRLDLDTSGLVIFSKCEYIQECLIKQMSSSTFQKEYLCLVERIIRQQIWFHSFANC